MARYLKRLGLFLLIQGLVAAIVIRSTRRPQDDHYLASLADKHAALVSAPGPRLIVVGGSSAAFGVSSPQLHDQLGVEPINMGAHFSSGLEFMLAHVERHVRPGDTILLCPETQLLCAPLLPEPRFVEELLSAWPPAADYLPESSLPQGYVRPTWKEYFDRRALQEFAFRFHSFRRETSRSIRGRPARNPDNIYVRSSFNRYGDVVAHHSRASKSFELEPVPYDQQRLDATIARLNCCATICRSQGAEVCFAFAPLVDEAVAASRPAVKAIEERLEAKLDIPILLSPEDAALPRSEFYDTQLHLTANGARIRTQKLIEQLQSHVSVARRAERAPVTGARHR